MENQFSRTELLIGTEGLEKLAACRVAVFGIGGVGSYAAEALARSGVGALDLIDPDKVVLSNLNRQLYALHSTIGMYKVDAAKARILDINPDCRVNTYKTFFLPENADEFDFSLYDYVIDAVDTVTAKLELAVRAEKSGVPIISAMGAGNKLDAAAFMAADIYETSVCPLAKVMRRELKKRGIKSLKVVYSKEESIKVNAASETEEGGRRSVPGSIAFVPSVAGLIIAGEVIKDCIRKHPSGRAKSKEA